MNPSGNQVISAEKEKRKIELVKRWWLNNCYLANNQAQKKFQESRRNIYLCIFISWHVPKRHSYSTSWFPIQNVIIIPANMTCLIPTVNFQDTRWCKKINEEQKKEKKERYLNIRQKILVRQSKILRTCTGIAKTPRLCSNHSKEYTVSNPWNSFRYCKALLRLL